MASRVRLTAGVVAVAAGVGLLLAATTPAGGLGLGATTPPADDGSMRVTETYRPADPATSVAPRRRPGRAASTLVIPRIGLRARLVAGTDDAALARGVGVWDNDTEPGGRGNYVLAGHRVTHGEPFADLPALRPGDRVAVDTASYRFVYEMDTTGDAYRVDDRELWPVSPVPRPMRGGSDRILTLITCAETFSTDDRFVAFGHLVSVRPVGDPAAPRRTSPPARPGPARATAERAYGFSGR